MKSNHNPRGEDMPKHPLFSLLEPGSVIADVNPDLAQHGGVMLSQAISLKRIADALQERAMDAADFAGMTYPHLESSDLIEPAVRQEPPHGDAMVTNENEISWLKPDSHYRFSMWMSDPIEVRWRQPLNNRRPDEKMPLGDAIEWSTYEPRPGPGFAASTMNLKASIESWRPLL